MSEDSEGEADICDEPTLENSVGTSEILTLWGEALNNVDTQDSGATLGGPDFDVNQTMSSTDLPRFRSDSDSHSGDSAIMPNGKISFSVNAARVGINRMSVRMEDGQVQDGDFIIRNQLGRGGMGIIYSARQNSLDREVAVKMISPGLAGRPDVRQKFISEALVTGQLEHPNIVPVYELASTTAGNLFYAMKEVGGKSWASAIHSLPRRDNILILLKVADAVAFAHAKGIIHRDLKPSNVMLGDFGEVVVMDWGVAVGLSEDAKAEPLTASNAVAGTPAYMAPEMARGMLDRMGIASDIYLLGAILFEIVSGQRPHAGENHVLRLKAAAENAIVPHDPDDEYIKVALKAMATGPADRYATVKELQNAILEVGAHRESIILSEDAAASLLRAEEGGDYGNYAQALYAYREAIKLWPGNAAAVRGEIDAAKKYAACAFFREDFDLALDILARHDDAETGEMIARVSKAKAQAKAKARRVRILTAVAFGLAAVVVLILAFAGIVISDRMDKEREAKESALDALRDREVAMERLRQEIDEREAAQREKEKAESARQALVAELTRKGYLEDDAWWVFSPGEAQAMQAADAMIWETPIVMGIDLDERSQLSLSLVPSGEFVMGSRPRDMLRSADEFLHRVKLNTPFYMSCQELTRGQWQAIMGREQVEDLLVDIPEFTTPEELTSVVRAQEKLWGWRARHLADTEFDQPATGISAREVEELFLRKAQRFAPKGWRFDLPTEAEWEFACRAGTSTQFFTGDMDDAGFELPGWTSENSGLSLHQVGSLRANPWELQDMHGNVGEMVKDYYSVDYYLNAPIEDPVNLAENDYRVFRGGTYLHAPSRCRSAGRGKVLMDNRSQVVGFRLVLRKE